MSDVGTGAAVGFGLGGPVGAGIGAVGGFLGDLFGASSANDFNAEQAALNRGFMAEQAGKAMTWQRDMRRNAYQDTVEDMKAAGINPMMAIQQGPNSTPTASSGPGGSTTAPAENVLGSAVHGAMAGAQLMADMNSKNADATLKHAAALTEVKKQENLTTSSGLNEEDTHKRSIESHQLEMQNSAVAREAQARENRGRLDLENDARERILNQVKTGTGVVTDALGAAGSALKAGSAWNMAKEAAERAAAFKRSYQQ